MVRGSAARRLIVVLGSWLLLAIAAPAAQAFEYLEGRIQVHGYFEETVRAISTDFNQSFDLTQWYNTLHIETDIDIAKDGWGPFDSIGAYIGLEARYDCVWTRACGLSRSVDVYGNRSTSLPSRLSNAKNLSLSGTTLNDTNYYLQPGRNIETRKVYPNNANPLSAANGLGPAGGGPCFPGQPCPGVPLPATVAGLPNQLTNMPPAGRLLGDRVDFYRGLSQTQPFAALIETRVAFGPLGQNATPYIEYIPGRYTFQRYLNYGFALRNIRGTNNGLGIQQMPWDPKDDIDPQGTLADRVNPFSTELNPVTGFGAPLIPTGPDLVPYALPYRPAPLYDSLRAPNSSTANGLFVPSQPYADYVRDGGSDKFDQNFSQERLAWNIGASQEQTWFLKEAYLELETLGGALFLRLGRQTIVWGKTELFATTDLFNAVDLALGSLTSLEESRIPQWAARAIYSFYEVGPFEDVRLEVAVDLDDFNPNDLGRCGEAYTPNPVCDKTFGLLVHGVAGIGAAGENRPPHWWDSAEGLQGGARLEFRWDRFSFALVDFYNYTKLPYADRLTTYSRNVDPETGRPRRYGATGPCTDGTQASCLQGGEDALLHASVNQQLYAVVCSSSIGFSSLDRSSCAQSVLTSPNFVAVGASAANFVGQLVSGSANGVNLARLTQFLGVDAPTGYIPLVSLSIDATDTAPFGSGSFTNAGANFAGRMNDGTLYPTQNHNNFQSLAQVTSPAQQALLGCGPFYGTSCDGSTASAFPGDITDRVPGGIDLLNAEASALVQAWSGFDGSPIGGLLATDASTPQPGTVGYEGGPICTRALPGGGQVVLPGCRSPYIDPKNYNQAVDGGPTPGQAGIGFPFGRLGIPAFGSPALGPIQFRDGHPYTGQTWASEMAALSWNLQMVLVAFSTQSSVGTADGDPSSNPALRFDPSDPYRTDGCSYVVPWRCSAVRAFWGVTGVHRQSVNAGGNGRFGRRDMAWAMGGEVVLKYQKRNVFGFSTDFAEDVTKTNWGMEFTWVRKQPFADQNEFVGYNKTDALNLTFSVDRPTFINFLNQSRTFFFNSQVFFSYVPGYHNSFTSNGPWNVFGTFTIQTGYFQDRLLPGITWVYDVQSESGAALPSVTYRFTESFSATLGFALFWGRYEGKDLPINPVGPSNQAGRDSYNTWVENGLSLIRDRDEAYVRIRYTF